MALRGAAGAVLNASRRCVVQAVARSAGRVSVAPAAALPPALPPAPHAGGRAHLHAVRPLRPVGAYGQTTPLDVPDFLGEEGVTCNDAQVRGAPLARPRSAPRHRLGTP